MSQVLGINDIVRLVTVEDTRNNEDFYMVEKKIVRLDFKKGKVIQSKSFWDWFSLNIKYYLVYTGQIAYGSTNVLIYDFVTMNAINLKIVYQVRCEKGNEENAVLALYKANDPLSALNNHLNQLVMDFSSRKQKNNNHPVFDYYPYKEELMNYLIENIYKKTGLKIELNFNIENEDELKSLFISSEIDQIRVKDSDEVLKLKFEIELKLSEKNRINAIIEHLKQKEIENIVQEKIKDFLLLEIKLHDLIYELNNSVKNRLIENLENWLEKKGRKISWMKLELEHKITLPDNTLNFEHHVQCDISDYSKKIDVQHKLLMQLIDLGKYKAKQISNKFDEEVMRELDRITREILFKKRYVDILLDFGIPENEQKILKEIRQQMEVYTASIGYTVMHLIVEPNMMPLIIKRDGFIVQKTSEFATFNNRVSIKLEIVVTGKIKDLREISRYITPDKNLIKEIEQAVFFEAEKQMHKVEPEKYYMPFNFPEEEPITEMLRKCIRGNVEHNFAAENVIVTIKTLETALLSRIFKLMSGNPYYVDIVVVPLFEGGTNEPVYFQIEFLIRTISSWNTFIYKGFDSIEEELKSIKTALANDISEKFQTVPYEVLRYFSYENSRKLLEVARVSQSKISILYGLDIKVTYVKREVTMIEGAQQELLLKKIDTQLEQKKEILEIDKEAAIENFDKLSVLNKKYIDPEFSDENPTENIKKKLEDIRNKTYDEGIDAGNEALKPFNTNSVGDWNPGEYVDEYALKNSALSPGKESGINTPQSNSEKKREEGMNLNPNENSEKNKQNEVE